METDTPDGTTPFNADGLLIPATSRAMVFLAESENIVQADAKHFKKRKDPKIDWFTEAYVRQIHKDMYQHVWQWAGTYRQADIAMAFAFKKHQIVEGVANLCRDIGHWDKVSQNLMSIEERAACLHHRLTVIHPFPDGNGRHARFMSDLYLFSHGRPTPQWPSADIMKSGPARREYLSALRTADRGDYAPLVNLMRTFSAGQ